MIIAVLQFQVVGLILVIALLTLPAAISQQYVYTMRSMMSLAVLLGVHSVISISRSQAVDKRIAKQKSKARGIIRPSNSASASL